MDNLIYFAFPNGDTCEIEKDIIATHYAGTSKKSQWFEELSPDWWKAYIEAICSTKQFCFNHLRDKMTWGEIRKEIESDKGIVFSEETNQLYKDNWHLIIHL